MDTRADSLERTMRVTHKVNPDTSTSILPNNFRPTSLPMLTNHRRSGPPGGQELYRSDPSISASSSPYPQQQHPYGQPDPNQHQQHGAYAQTPGQPPYHDPNAPPYDPNAPFDPNAPEGERGLGSALAGGAAGYWAGHKKGHGFLGAVGGAIVGNILGDKFKEHREHGRHDGHSGGGSSWGGKW